MIVVWFDVDVDVVFALEVDLNLYVEFAVDRVDAFVCFVFRMC